MTKSRGNVVDPLALIDDYGADALRFTLIITAAQGRDVKLSRARVEGYRNFATKLWNAARFCALNDCAEREGFDPRRAQIAENKWIIGALAAAQCEITRSFEDYRFNDAAKAAYHFVWHIFCDWFVEFAKHNFHSGDETVKAETRAVAGWALNRTLRLLHPFMPFITEALWEQTAPSSEAMLILADWPVFEPDLTDEAVQDEIDWLVRLISSIRSVRAEINVPAAARIAVVVVDANAQTQKKLAAYRAIIKHMARLSELTTDERIPENCVQTLLDEAVLCLRLSGIVDLAAEADRLRKEISKAEGFIAKTQSKLANENFLAHAPDHVVKENRARLTADKAIRARLAEALKRIS